MRWLSAVYASLALVPVSLAASADQWRGRIIYQIMTDRFARSDGSTTAPCVTEEGKYCGGTWKGITSQLDYIQNMGFTAIWISPIVKQIQDLSNGSPYHGYWPQDLYSLNSNFGTADDLKSLASALHSRGMYLMVDVTPNDFAYVGNAADVDYSQFSPFNDTKYFHPPCVMDYLNQTSTEVCWLSTTANALADVRTEDDYVSSTYQAWIKDLISEYGIDGIRLDAANHMAAYFLTQFVNAAGVYVIGEVFEGDPSYSCGYQNQLSGFTNYNTYYGFLRAFTTTGSRGQMGDWVDLLEANINQCKDTSLLGQFTENHDIARYAMLNDDMNMAKNALVYTILSDGIPIVWEAQEQHFAALGGTPANPTPFNREATWLSKFDRDAELVGVVGSLNLIRNYNQASDKGFLSWKQRAIYTDDNTIAFRKGTDGQQLITVLTNVGSGGGQYTLQLNSSGYAPGTQLTEVLSCATTTVDGDGTISVAMGNGLPKALLPSSVVSGWGVCAH